MAQLESGRPHADMAIIAKDPTALAEMRSEQR